MHVTERGIDACTRIHHTDIVRSRFVRVLCTQTYVIDSVPALISPCRERVRCVRALRVAADETKIPIGGGAGSSPWRLTSCRKSTLHIRSQCVAQEREKNSPICTPLTCLCARFSAEKEIRKLNLRCLSQRREEKLIAEAFVTFKSPS